MNEVLTLDQRIALLASGDEERLTYFTEQAKQHGQIWTLSNEEGFVMVETDDGDCVMVWPDEEFAAQWAVEDWDDCEASVVTLDVFLQQWLPSLEKDNISIAVFPNIEDEGALLAAAQLRDRLS